MANDSDFSMVERVARAMMEVCAVPPGNISGGAERPVLSSDPDYDDLPLDGSQGTVDDDITQEAVLKLARAAIAALREPLHEAIMTASDPEQGMHLATLGAVARRLEAMISAALSS